MKNSPIEELALKKKTKKFLNSVGIFFVQELIEGFAINAIFGEWPAYVFDDVIDLMRKSGVTDEDLK